MRRETRKRLNDKINNVGVRKTEKVLSDLAEHELINKEGRWDDLRFPLVGRRLDSAAGNLDYNYAEVGVDFAANSDDADNESLIFVAQMPHAWEEGTEIYPHLHWKQSQDNNVAWQLKYRMYTNGEAVPTTWVTVPMSTLKYTYTTGTLAQISTIPAIDMTGFSISTIIEFKLARIGASDSYTGNALATEFDVHYKTDSFGSEEEFLKY